MTVTYCTTKQVVEFLQIQKVVVAEAVGTGNGTTSVFYLANTNVVAGTYTIYVAGAIKTETTQYTFDKDTGKITFTAGNIPTTPQAITADYWYTPVSNSYLTSAINRAEDKIDNMTNNAWRLRYSGSSGGADTTQHYEYHNIHHRWYWGTGIPHYIGRRFIRTFDSASGDTMEAWNGTTTTGKWEDLLSTATQNRENDWWLDQEGGTLWIRRWWYSGEVMQVRLKYRYGESVVPYDIEELAIKLAARDVIFSDDRSFLLPEGSQNVPLVQKMSILDMQIKELFKNRTDLPLVMQ